MGKPLFSVIIPALNEEKFLPILLGSLASQTNKSFEVIVVDGKSKDDTVKVSKSFRTKLPHLKVVTSTKPSLPGQRNLGASHARGEWLVFVDADCVFMPYFMARASAFIKETNPTVFATWFLPDSAVSADALFTLIVNIACEMSLVVKRQFTPGPLTIVHKNAFNAVSGYNEEHTFNEDVDFGFRLGRAGYTVSILRETLCMYSLRRYRKEGTLRVIQQYAKGGIVALLTRNALRSMPGYVMGGHLYGKRKKVKQSVLKVYERKLKELGKELFS
jgi:glycosyltransferase involved in cell wall biosynthesis